MAKRYHASKRARRSEHMGMESYERGPVRKIHNNDENHVDDRIDPEHFRAHRRGQEVEANRRSVEVDQGYYAGPLMRHRLEMQDAGMIHEDPRKIANLPQEVMMKEYPKNGMYLPEVLDDTIAGVDRQINYDDYKRAQTFYPKKV